MIGVRTLFGALLLVPVFAGAQTVQSIVFTSDAQTIPVSTVSSQLTIQAQSSGASVNIPQTGCLSLQSSSGSGQFSSSATNWSPITVLTMNKSTANKNFYYQDASAGSFTLTIKLALKPTDESRSCSSWPTSEWGTTYNASQQITVGSATQSSQSDTTQSDSSQTQNTSQTQNQQSAPIASYVPPPLQQIFADAGPDRTVIVGADVEFDGRAYNRNKELLNTVRFTWNFGDGETAEGPAVVHHYNYPGRYALILNAAADLTSVGDEVIVTAEPAQLAFTVNADGSVAIENNAGRDLDLSNWIVRSYNELFKLPSHSIILSGGMMRISHETLKFFASAQTELAYPNGVTLLRGNETTSAKPAASVPAPTVQQTPAAPVVSLKLQTAAAADPASADGTTSALSLTAAAAAATGSLPPWALGGLTLLVIAAGFAAFQLRRGVWDIAALSGTVESWLKRN